MFVKKTTKCCDEAMEAYLTLDANRPLLEKYDISWSFFLSPSIRNSTGPHPQPVRNLIICVLFVDKPIKECKFNNITSLILQKFLPTQFRYQLYLTCWIIAKPCLNEMDYNHHTQKLKNVKKPKPKLSPNVTHATKVALVKQER